MSLAEAFARSGFFSDATDAAKAVVKIVAGQELGIPPVAAMTGINIVQGRVNLSANILAGLVKRHPAYDYQIITQTDTECTISFSEGDDVLGISTFTMDDAAQAGLASKQNWRLYPRNMLFARAISNGVKWFCPDVTAGMPVYTPDEMGQDVNEDGSMRLFATPDQLDAVRQRLVSLFPDVKFQNDGHYNYVLKANGYPKLSEMTAEQAEATLDTLRPPETPQYEPVEANGVDEITAEDLKEEQAPRVGKDPAELIAKGKSTPAPPEPQHWIDDPKVRARFWAWTGDLGLSNDEVHAALMVESVKDFGGTMAEAKSLIETWLEQHAGAEPQDDEPF